MIRAISPTSLKLFLEDRAAFYRKYVLRDGSDPQTQPMAAGSAFDSFVKAYLRGVLYGANEAAERTMLFESAVESHNRDWGLVAGAELFAFYKGCGALATLVMQLQEAKHPPRMEMRVDGVVHSARLGKNIPVSGYPDLYFLLDGSAGGVITISKDWKVSGYCSKASPAPGYLNLYGNHRKAGTNHPDAVPLMDPCGLVVCGAQGLEAVNADWARQQCLYCWMLGGEGRTDGDFIVGIEQLTRSGSGGLVCSQYCNRVS